MMNLFPTFLMFGIILVLLFLTIKVRPKLPEIAQPFFTYAMIIVCLIAVGKMLPTVLSSAFEGVMKNAFDFTLNFINIFNTF